VDGYLGATIAKMAAREFRKGRTVDALKLDANYVRRSDAEIFSKGMRRMAAEAGSASPRIRTFRPQDAAALTRILKDSPEAAQWTEQSRRELLESPVIVVFVSESGHDVSGFVVGRQVADEAEILNIAVTPTARQKGEGTDLMEAAIGVFLSRGASRVFLEVRESNRKAIAFYERQGFCKAGRRAGYYQNPEGAALVMEKKLSD